MMKILIAYDGSESADIGIAHLGRAGLPLEADALVVSVAEVWLPPPGDEVIDDTYSLQVSASLERTRAHAAKIVEHAQQLSESAGKRVRHIFPGWTVRCEAMTGSPAYELLTRVREWQPNLVVVGSHGRTALGRFVLGSVSQKVLTEAQSSVRVARQSSGTGASGIRIVLAVDGSVGAQEAVRSVATRDWTPGSEVRVVVAEDVLTANPVYALIPPVNEFLDEVNRTERTEAERIAEDAVKELRIRLENKNVTVSSRIVCGVPKQVLVRHAEEFGADCIFTGATGFSTPIDRLLVGSVSAAVAARAQCSVEVVRAQ